MDNTYSMIPIFTSVAIQTSISVCQQGIPMGGMFSWAIIVIMANDSGQYPYAPLQAAIIGFPIIILCDISLIIPALIIKFILTH